MNFLHLQFENFAYESCKFFSDIFYELGQISKVHPVIANLIVLLSSVLAFGVIYCFLDFIEKEYVPIIKKGNKRIKDTVKARLLIFKRKLHRFGRKLQKIARKMVKASIYLIILAFPLFIMGILLRGGLK